jgi:hypothetical protein
MEYIRTSKRASKGVEVKRAEWEIGNILFASVEEVLELESLG